MKKAGLLILVFGLVITLFTGYNYVTKEKIVEIGNLGIVAEEASRTNGSHKVGISVMLVGGIIFIVGGRGE